VRGKSATDAGIIIIPLMICCCVGTGAAAMLVGRNGAWACPTALCLGFVFTLTSLGLALTFKEEEKLVAEIFILLLAGLGLGLVGQAIYMAAQASCKLSGKTVTYMLQHNLLILS
jgi:uncharacterized membrane protein